MNMDRKIIIIVIAVCVVFLAGIAVLAHNGQNQNQTAYEIPLKTQAFNFFDMEIPIDSNFSMKSNQSEDTRGMIVWQNKGNFSKDVDLIVISKNYTDVMIPEKMKLVSNSDSQKVYMSKNYDGNYYRIVKTFNGTDIIVSGHNLDLLKKMLNTTKVKDTSKLAPKMKIAENKTVNNTTQAGNNTIKNNTANNTTQVENNTTKNNTANNTTQIKKTVENKTPVKKIVEKKIEDKKQNENKSKVENPPKGTPDPLMIGGGSFTTGSGSQDKTYARIYVGVDHAGEPVGVKIYYSRDGTNLNQGNYVGATVKSDGYIDIVSADAYAKYPDFAYIELYNAVDDLVATQGVHLNPTSGTQYF